MHDEHNMCWMIMVVIVGFAMMGDGGGGGL